MRRKIAALTALFFSFFVILPRTVSAHCPLCTVATGMAVATTRLYGIDDMIIGLFIGSFVVSTALWMNNIALKRNRKKEYLPYQSFSLVLVSLLTMLATLYFSGLLGDMNYQALGMDKIFFGTLAGTVITLVSFEIHKKLRWYNGNRNYVPMQGIILPLLSVVIASLGFYAMGLI